METLHILNGDATLEKFKKASIDGQCMVWREVLVQGPLFYQVNSELFWDMRAQFMEEAFGVKLSEYRRKVIKEFDKLRKFSSGEIILWYEYDLFCQVNFIALMSYMLRNKKRVKVSMICVGDFPDFDRRVGLGEIPFEKYTDLHKERVVLTKDDLLLADKAWMFFCGKTLENYKELHSDKLIYLQDAFQAALSIFPEQSGEHSKLEKRILQLRDDQKLAKKEIIKTLMQEDRELGFGDLQYEYLLRKLD